MYYISAGQTSLLSNLKKAGLASRNIVHFFKKSHSTLYRSLLSLSSFIFIKPIRSTFDPTYTCRIIVHGCLLGHYENHTLWGGTYLYSLYRGVPPPGWPRVISTMPQQQTGQIDEALNITNSSYYLCVLKL